VYEAYKDPRFPAEVARREEADRKRAEAERAGAAS
jgi:hypothetical protein